MPLVYTDAQNGLTCGYVDMTLSLNGDTCESDEVNDWRSVCCESLIRN